MIKHASIYLTEGAVANATKRARNRYIEYRQKDGEHDIQKLKEEFEEFKDELRGQIGYLRYTKEINGKMIYGLKYIDGCTRIFFETRKNLDVLKKLDLIIGILVKDIELYNTYDGNFNELSYYDLDETFQDKLEKISSDEHDEVENMGYSNQSSSYDIIPINSFEEASEYYYLCIHKNFSNNDNKPEWCLTYGKEHFNSYTNNGTNQVYFCIKKDISENDEPIQGDGHPQDEYGNSMISIIVDEEGELSYATSRWNHELEGSDKAYSVVDISRIVGVDFYKTFLPNRLFQTNVERALRLFNQNSSFKGFSKYEVSNIKEFFKVKVLNKYNFLNIKTGELLSKRWYDKIENFHDGFALVGIHSKGFNFISTNGELLSKRWYDIARDFQYGVASIQIKNKGWNIINTEGKILSKEWFNIINFFRDGVAPVKKLREDGKIIGNLLTINGKLLSDTWFDNIEEFRNGYARVRINDKGMNFINPNGEFLSDIWFSNAEIFINGLSKVYIDNKGYNFLNRDGEILFDNWFASLSEFEEGYARVKVKGKGRNFINIHGEFLSDIWFDDSENFKNGYALVYISGKGWNIIDTHARFVSDRFYDGVSYFNEGFARVNIDKKQNFINKNGEIISDIWFDITTVFKEDGFATVSDIEKGWFKIDGFGNIYDRNDNIIHKGRLASQQNIANESLKHKYAKELNEVLNLNNRIKKLYE